MNDKRVFNTKPKKQPSTNFKKIPKLGGILGLISFSTILPINIHTSIEEMASFTWFWPIIGGMIGIFVGTVGFLSLNVLHLPSLLTSALVYSFAIWFTGFHHLDGLMDMGDGLMVHGDYAKKINVMRDMMIGTGGISLFLIIALITFSSINAIPAALIFLVLLVSEISAKMSLLSCATFSTPLSNGTGQHFINSMNIPLLVFSLVITSIIGFFALKLTGILGIIGALIGGYIISMIAKKHFRYATGDILGASNEIGRAVSLVVMITALIYL
ncbi:adenosylcobinamide-GDP ribazoletransferase [Methanobacterium sp. ACI-7]|uniref:adenosylcobinamide-GDP ribazoletransferase n=1 Tax=unclassified Methanobacterium TaxID=2627676 RepID=UPI0039C35B0E